MKLSRSHIASLSGRSGLLGLALVSGLGPAPALSGPSSDGSDDGTTSTTDATIPTSISSSPATGATGSPMRAGRRRTVTVAEEGTGLRLLKAEPATGWTVEVEESAGREVEVDFRRGTERVQVNLEIEDGAVRERVRFRDAPPAELLVEDGVVVGPTTTAPPIVATDDDHTDDRGRDGTTRRPGPRPRRRRRPRRRPRRSRRRRPRRRLRRRPRRSRRRLTRPPHGP